jgi:hypothetical protein
MWSTSFLLFQCLMFYILSKVDVYIIIIKLYPLYAMEAQGGRGGIAPTHT